MTETVAPSELVPTLSCPDQLSVVHAVSGIIGSVKGNIIQSQQFSDPDSGLFFIRVEIDSPVGRAPIEETMANIAGRFEATWSINGFRWPLRTIIMASRGGRCLTDLLYHQHSQGLPIEVIAVVGNHPNLTSVVQFYGVPFLDIPVTKNMKARAEAELFDLVRSGNVELIILARYMQILFEKICGEMAGRIISIRHFFLPSSKGVRPYAQIHDHGVKLIGVTARYVTPDLDEGPIIEQDVTRITHADSTPDTVSLGQDVERRVLAQAVCRHTERRVLLDGARTIVFAR